MISIQTIKDRFSGRPDTEHQQAMIRLFIGFTITAYWRPDQLDAGLQVGAVGAMVWVAFLVISCLIPVWIYFDPKVNHPRRIFTILTDMTATGAVMILTGENGIAMVLLYLWTTSGTGFRYGQTYLFISLALGVISLLFVLNFSEPFLRNPSLGHELLLGYILFSLYINTLVKKLYLAVETATSASRAKQTFLSTMSHELRTPLHAMTGLTALLKSEIGINRKASNFIGSIETAVGQMLHIVNDILDFAKIEAGKVEVVSVPFDLDAMNIAMVKMFSCQAEQKQLRFRTYFSSDLPVFFVSDEERIQQILSNVLSNAIKFTDTGEVVLSVELHHHETGVASIKWTITDTGIGIEEALLTKIFDSFTQADANTSRKYGGTGLGTTIARQFVLLLGGELGISSTPGKGTTIWFTLPVRTPIVNDAPALPSSIPLLALVPAEKHEVIALCRQTHARLITDPELIESEISADDPDVAGLIVFCKEGNLPPLAQLAIAKKIQVVAIASPGSEKSRKRVLDQGVMSLCDADCKLPRAIRMLQVWSGIVSEPVDIYADAGISGKRILIADDNVINVRILSTILQKQNHVVTITFNGKDALERVFEEDFDLIILDMNMPIMNGLDAAKKIRAANIRNASIPIAILTADATKETEKQAMESGADIFLTKPVTPAALNQKLSLLFAGMEVRSSKTFSSKKAVVVLNLETLRGLTELGTTPDFMRALIDVFLVDSNVNMMRLLTAFESNNYRLWRNTVHDMQGMAINLGLESMHLILTTAYDLPAHSFQGEARSIFSRIQTEYIRAEVALHEFFQVPDVLN